MTSDPTLSGGIVADPLLGGSLGGGQGPAGPPGRDGTSAYDLAGGDAEWGSLPAWLASLASGGAERSYAVAIAAHGQTVLPISPPPALLSTLCLTVNGIDYRAPLALSATELAVTWSGGFPLDPSDDVHVSYF
jgi:hypothetical protein